MSLFSKIGTITRTMRAKPADAPDGLTDQEAAAPTAAKARSSFLNDFMSQAKRGKLGADAHAILQGMSTMASGEPINDRELLLEHGVTLLQNLPENSELSKTLSDAFIGVLWRDLPHPPTSYLGPQNNYRAADGSGNNCLLPDLGKAGTPYSRSVTSTTPRAPNLPDPGLVFDALLKRDKFVPHPSGISSLFFAFATLVIHECFQTNRENHWINDTTSYVDLSTLYGNNAAEQAKVRTFKNGTLWPDVISSSRIMMMPPAVSALLVLFSRNHNWIALRLLAINEKGKYKSDLSKLTDEQKKWQDEDIFQLSRNINVGFFAAVVLRDYVNVILNTVRADSEWNLDLGAEIKSRTGDKLERGTGNCVSVEFNVLYRWHAALSEADDQWTQNLFKKALGERDLTTITPREFFELVNNAESALTGKEPKDWEIHGLKRDPDGRYDDAALAEILKKATDEPAGAFKARGSPAAFKIIEVLGMIQARDIWGVCTMNEFRKFLNLKPFSTFKEWNSDPEIAAAAEALYVHPDNLELYPGLLAEEAKPSMRGSGVAPGHTIARGILDDAVALVRGDRFLTNDLSVNTLTSWGFEQLTPAPGSRGGILSKILFNTLPTAYPFNSTYAHFGFLTPPTIKEILTTQGRIKDYDTSRPGMQPALHGINTYASCKRIFEDRETFGVLYDVNIRKVTNDRGFLIGWDEPERHDPAKIRVEGALFQPGFEGPLASFFAKSTADLIKQSSFNLSDTKARYVDIVRDVTNVAPILFIADRFAIPIKTKENPHGLVSPKELYAMLCSLFVYSSFDLIPKAGWTLREAAIKSARIISPIIEARIKSSSTGFIDRVERWLASKTPFAASAQANAFYGKLVKSGKPVEDLTAECIGSMIPIAGNITQQSGLLVNLYLEPAYAKEKARIVELVAQNTKDAEDELLGYIWEGLRLAPVVIGIPRMAKKDTTVQDGDKTVEIKKGDRILVSLSNANMDPAVFPEPEKIDPKRPRSSYMLLGHGMHYCLGARLVGISLLAMLKEIFKLKNLRRAPGKAGQFARFTENLHGSKAHMYLTPNNQESPFPYSLALMYDTE